MEIFKKISLKDLIQIKNEEAKDLINRYTDKEISENDLEKLEEEVFSKTKIEPVIIDENTKRVINKTQGTTQEFFHTKGLTEVNSIDVTYAYNFNGTGLILGCASDIEYDPKALSLSDEHYVDLQNNTMMLKISVPMNANAPEEVEQKRKEILSIIFRYLVGLNQEAVSLNSKLKSTINYYLAFRKNKASILDRIN